MQGKIIAFAHLKIPILIIVMYRFLEVDELPVHNRGVGKSEFSKLIGGHV